MTNRPKKHRRHTVSLSGAARELGTDPRTLEKRLVEARTSPDEAGRYRWATICQALSGDANAERLGKLRAERRLAEIAVAERQRVLVPLRPIQIEWEHAAIHLRVRLMEIARQFPSGYPLWTCERDCRDALDREIRGFLNGLGKDVTFLAGAPEEETADPSSRLLEPLSPAQPA